MKIKKQLPQFSDVAALIIVASRQHGLLYRAHAGSVEKLDEFNIPTPTYSDNEGFFRRGGHGVTYATGSVREFDKQDLRKKFVKLLREKVNELLKHADIDIVYLFAPRQNLKEEEASLPAAAKKRLAHSFGGNHIKDHPFDLLAKIQSRHARARDQLL